jgi:tetratricopeptide (TPR) repeat protein
MKVQAALQAETAFKKAEVLAKLKKFDEALEHLDEAIKLKGDDTEFKVYRVYYGFLQAQRGGTANEADAEKAIKAIQALMKNDANIAAGYMFLGHLYKVVGKANVAVKYFEKVLEYDDRNADAQREVRLYNMRAEKDKKKKWSPF